tara:strand:- start:2369 stop:2674 length:306 start_codon:yes stop_codon:yes gene_type:complete
VTHVAFECQIPLERAMSAVHRLVYGSAPGYCFALIQMPIDPDLRRVRLAKRKEHQSLDRWAGPCYHEDGGPLDGLFLSALLSSATVNATESLLKVLGAALH